MDKLERFTIIITLADKLKLAGSWCGETHIQKALYFLQELTDIDTGLNFILYKHGPFSFNLQNEIRTMEAESYLHIEPTPPYGACLKKSKKGEVLQNELGTFLDSYNKQIDFIVLKIGSLGVANLEKLATALFEFQENKNANLNILARNIHKMKPHIEQREALTYLNKVLALLKESEAIKQAG